MKLKVVPYILALDQGTPSSRALVFDAGSTRTTAGGDRRQRRTLLPEGSGAEGASVRTSSPRATSAVPSTSRESP